ncbi:MAG: hypothetical protein R3B81_06560 [bacterium]
MRSGVIITTTVLLSSVTLTSRVDAAHGPIAREIGGATESSSTAVGRDGFSVLFSDDFESGLAAWSVIDVAGVGAQWGPANCWSVSGTASAACASAGSAAITCGESYPADMKTWLIYGPFDLSDSSYAAAHFDFELALQCERYHDRFFAGTSTDGTDFAGTFWEATTETGVRMDLTSHLGRDQVWIGFQFESDGSDGRADGASIDDVSIVAVSPVPDQYGWSISESSTDPRDNVGVPWPPQVRTLYLWLTCVGPDVAGMSAAAFDVFAEGGLLLGFTPEGGFLNAGSGPSLLLAVAGCPSAPVRAGSIAVWDQGSGFAVCLQPNGDGVNGTVDCDSVNPLLYPNDHIGYESRGFPGSPCSSGTLCTEEITVSVDRTSWADLKALYR